MQRVDTEICLFSKVYSISVEKPQKESASGETDLRKLFNFSSSMWRRNASVTSWIAVSGERLWSRLNDMTSSCILDIVAKGTTGSSIVQSATKSARTPVFSNPANARL